METGILREISPLGEHDFMYVADRHKKEFDYPIHQHEIFELNFIVGASGCRRVEVNSDSKRILNVKNHIDQHYKDEMSLEQLANLVGMISSPA